MILQNAFILPYFKEIDALLNNYVYNGYQALMGYIQLPLGVLMVMAIGFLGYQCYTSDNVRVKDFYSFSFKFAFIYFFAINWGHFSQYIVTFFNDAVINGMGAALLQANPVNIPGATNVETALQLMSTIFQNISNALFGEAGIRHLSFFFYGGMVWLITTVMIAIALIEMTLAKIMMAILFVVAPAIIPCVMFEKTKSIFTNWMGNLVGHSLLLVFISALMGLASNLIFWVIPVKTAEAIIDVHGLAWGIVPFLIIIVITVYAMTKVHSMAMQIGSGVASGGTGMGLMMGLVGGLSMSRALGGAGLSAGKNLFSLGKGAAKGAYSAATAPRQAAQNIAKRIKSNMNKGN